VLSRGLLDCRPDFLIVLNNRRLRTKFRHILQHNRLKREKMPQWGIEGDAEGGEVGGGMRRDSGDSL
jgi:hypothetical protein